MIYSLQANFSCSEVLSVFANDNFLLEHGRTHSFTFTAAFTL